MDYFAFLWIAAVLSVGLCDTQPITNIASVQRHGKSLQQITVASFLPCTLARDASCFIRTGQAWVSLKESQILAEADAAALGRASDGEAPSQLAQTIHHLIAEITGLFRDSLSGLFKTGREGDADDEFEKKNDASVARKKKKKGKLIALIKLIILGIVVAVKITLLLKALSAFLQVKFFLVALGGLALNAARLYFELKKGHNPQKVIYYEHAQHQHHYDGGEEDWGSSSPGGGYWGRSYDVEDAKPTGQELAYAKQIPARTPEAANNSWF